MSFYTRDYYFDLPEELIAQSPAEERSSSKLLTLNRDTGETNHLRFSDIVDLLTPNDCLVINDTKVIPARLLGNKKDTGGKVEILLLKRLEDDCWEAMINPGRKNREGSVIEFGNGMLTAYVLSVLPDGNRVVQFEYTGLFENVLDKLGQMPLPPYIKKELTEPERYQTVYAKHEGSAAAPTAGLHFTPELLAKLEAKGVKIARLTLHVGLGTFRPVKAEHISQHIMHSESYTLDSTQADIINQTKKNGGRVIAVGTTSARTLETLVNTKGEVSPGSGNTDIFIYPGYKFHAIDGLITNFHLPESTLIMLVSALAGREYVLNAYNEAVKMQYRFYSFGDAMFVYS